MAHRVNAVICGFVFVTHRLDKLCDGKRLGEVDPGKSSFNALDERRIISPGPLPAVVIPAPNQRHHDRHHVDNPHGGKATHGADGAQLVTRHRDPGFTPRPVMAIL